MSRGKIMSNVIKLEIFEGEPRVDSRLISKQLGVEHKSSMRLMKAYKADFEEFGVYRFEIDKPLNGTSGGRPQKFALLNEDQCYLLLSYSDNTPKSRELKKALVRAFSNARKQAGLDAAINLILLPKPTTWEKRFPDPYYEALAKITKTRYEGHANGTPYIFGQITDKWIYKVLLPQEVYSELKDRKDKSEKMHQWLTTGGQSRLDQHIQIITLMAQSSTDLRDFEARCIQAFGIPGQLKLIYPIAA